MSLNWKEINLILEELDLTGMQIQRVMQSAYDMLSLRLYGRGGAKNLLISLSPGACRLHESFSPLPKSQRPLRFAEFLNSRIVNGRIEEAIQLGQDRIVRLIVRCGEERFIIYSRLWSNAANVIVTDPEGNILDAMRRIPKKNEVSGGFYRPELKQEETGALSSEKPEREYFVRDFESPEASPSGESSAGTFNQKIDAYYRRERGSLSLEALREEARRKYEGNIGRLKASLERLAEKRAEFANPEQFREYGDLILSNQNLARGGSEWLEVKNFYSENEETVRIRVDPRKNPAAQAEDYYEQYRKAKSGYTEIGKQIEAEERELGGLEETLEKLLEEKDPLALYRALKGGGPAKHGGGQQGGGKDAGHTRRPGLSFMRKDWLILVGRDANENDTLLRKYVRGNDLWLHARDYPGSYVFIKHRPGKTVPLDILLDAGNLAIFYSKGRNRGEGDLFYTQVKYLRRAKNGPRGLVIPTQEKNLYVKLDSQRLGEMAHAP